MDRNGIPKVCERSMRREHTVMSRLTRNQTGRGRYTSRQRCTLCALVRYCTRASEAIECRPKLTLLFGADLLSQSKPSDLAADLNTYVGGRRDSAREATLLRRLRALPQPERLALLAPLLGLKSGTALMLIGRAQLSRSHYLEIFKLGLTKGNASSIKWWMDATVPHIGWHRTLSVLRETLATNPRGGALALYHVPWVCRGKGQLSGPLPTRELAVEYVRLLVHYHENGHRVVDDNAFDRLKKALSSHE